MFLLTWRRASENFDCFLKWAKQTFDEGKLNLFSFSSDLAFKQAKEQILF